jgi:hypothetical protein
MREGCTFGNENFKAMRYPDTKHNRKYWILQERDPDGYLQSVGMPKEVLERDNPTAPLAKNPCSECKSMGLPVRRPSRLSSLS